MYNAQYDKVIKLFHVNDGYECRFVIIIIIIYKLYERKSKAVIFIIVVYSRPALRVTLVLSLCAPRKPLKI